MSGPLTIQWRNGDVFEALEDTPVSFVTHWRAPFTGGGTGMIPKGTKVRVLVLNVAPAPATVYARPLEAEPVEHLLVPESDRKSTGYDGFSLCISTQDLGERFRRIEADPSAANRPDQ
jgi:hypothetical protein